MMQGRRHWRPPHGEARAMACGGNPRALPDLELQTSLFIRTPLSFATGAIWDLSSRRGRSKP